MFCFSHWNADTCIVVTFSMFCYFYLVFYAFDGINIIIIILKQTAILFYFFNKDYKQISTYDNELWKTRIYIIYKFITNFRISSSTILNIKIILHNG